MHKATVGACDVDSGEMLLLLLYVDDAGRCCGLLTGRGTVDFVSSRLEEILAEELRADNTSSIQERITRYGSLCLVALASVGVVAPLSLQMPGLGLILCVGARIAVVGVIHPRLFRCLLGVRAVGAGGFVCVLPPTPSPRLRII